MSTKRTKQGIIMEHKIIHILLLFVLASCSISPREMTANTDEVNQNTTINESEINTINLTVSVMNEDFTSSSIYNVKVGCFDSIPCILQKDLLFDKSGPVSEMNWSMDGKSLLFVGIDNGNLDIYIYDTVMKNITNITNTNSADETNPVWSYDGKEIVYIVAGEMEPSKIIKSSIDGKIKNRILEDVSEPFRVVWSKKGMIAYNAPISNQDIRYQIRILNPDLSLYWLIPMNKETMVEELLDFEFFPDDKYLIASGTKDETGYFEIYKMDIKNKSISEFLPTGNSCNQYKPTISQDSKWIAYISNCESSEHTKDELFIVDTMQKISHRIDFGVDGSVFDVTWNQDE